MLKQAGPDTIVFQASTVVEALAFIDGKTEVDAIVLDLVMPGVGGFQAITEFGLKRPDLPVIVLSSSEDPRDVQKALALGALGYVPKSASATVLLSAIKLVLNGDRYVPPLILNTHFGNNGWKNGQIDLGAGRLTERQVEVLNLLSKGQPNKTIATALNLSEKTVKAHITAIFKTLNVVNRTQAAAVGRQTGVIF